MDTDRKLSLEHPREGMMRAHAPPPTTVTSRDRGGGSGGAGCGGGGGGGGLWRVRTPFFSTAWRRRSSGTWEEREEASEDVTMRKRTTRPVDS